MTFGSVAATHLKDLNTQVQAAPDALSNSYLNLDLCPPHRNSEPCLQLNAQHTQQQGQAASNPQP